MTVEDFTRYRRLLAAHDEMRRQCVQQADETHSQRMKKFDCMRDAERAEKRRLEDVLMSVQDSYLRRLLELRFMQGLSCREIADKINSAYDPHRKRPVTSEMIQRRINDYINSMEDVHP